jgi:predicted DNA-binding transcriptional regulator AlpA
MMSNENVKQIESLWGTEECAVFFNVSQRQFQDRIMVVVGFPRPIRLPTPRGGRGHPKWTRAEIINWAEQQREAA